MRLQITNEIADFSNVPKLRTRTSSSSMLYEMSRKEPLHACSQSSLFCLLSAEGWVFYEIQTRQMNRLLHNHPLLQFGGFISKWCSSPIEVFPVIPLIFFSPRKQEAANYKPDFYMRFLTVLVLANYVHQDCKADIYRPISPPDCELT